LYISTGHHKKRLLTPVFSSAVLPPLLLSLCPGAPRSAPSGLVVVGAGRRFSIIPAGFGLKWGWMLGWVEVGDYNYMKGKKLFMRDD